MCTTGRRMGFSTQLQVTLCHGLRHNCFLLVLLTSLFPGGDIMIFFRRTVGQWVTGHRSAPVSAQRSQPWADRDYCSAATK